MKTCLIVDDSFVELTIGKKFMSKLGFHTAEAGDGLQALDICAKFMPDAILLDWNMPVMDGVTFLRELRTLPGGDHPFVVLCTSEGDMDRVLVAIEAGANDYILKPVDREVIKAKFEEAGLLGDRQAEAD